MTSGPHWVGNENDVSLCWTCVLPRGHGTHHLSHVVTSVPCVRLPPCPTKKPGLGHTGTADAVMPVITVQPQELNNVNDRRYVGLNENIQQKKNSKSLAVKS